VPLIERFRRADLSCRASMDGVNGENLLTASLRRDHEVILRALERLEEESDRLRYGRLERQE